MPKVSQIRISDDVVRIQVDQQRLTVLTDDYLDQPLRIGQAIDSEGLRRLTEQACYAEGYLKALRKLAAGDRSVHEINQLLDGVEGLSPQQHRRIIQLFKDRGYLDDSALTANAIADGQLKGQGPVKIGYDLKARGVGRAMVDQQLAAVPAEQWVQGGLAAASRYLAALHGLSSKARRQKTAQKLYALGYDRQVSDDILGRLDYDNGDDEQAANLQAAAAKAFRRYGRRHQGYQLRQDVYRCLAGQGYAPDEINAVIKESENDDEQ